MKGTSSSGTARRRVGIRRSRVVEDDLQFGARELLTDALVAAVAEAQLLGGVAAEVEFVGLRVGLGVPVGRGQIDDDAITGADGLAADLDILQWPPGAVRSG